MSNISEDGDIYSSQGNSPFSGLTGAYKPFSSPYLNYDPGYLNQAQPEFIFLDGASKQRGRMELAFGQIGGSCMIGAGIGGATGFYNGLRATTLAGQTGKLRRTQLINHIMKKGSATANTFGSVAVIYSAFGVILSWVRGTDDDLNTIAAATATGLLYKSTAGLKKCGIGGGIGLGVSLIYAFWNNRDKLTAIRTFNPAK
ncbi:mitochondrial import inner membrane translocase subunit Tim23 isoform X1 [Coccinella septempunctata]|uniref:mitochondrial import inner membrane translocase subunit Tim23 isoform X1 n=2 Tax=Coccinella septempunctata TaxID=41139 RepID=UPI001D0786EA|nr:mitochondrial import inner membrane translocase subunit Tim23 isoform X1 [Coccinella septempunctata]